jgi:tetratricopeptide (TPR) repeat protein
MAKFSFDPEADDDGEDEERNSAEENDRRKMLLQRQLGDLLRQTAKYEDAETVLKDCLRYFADDESTTEDMYFKIELLSSIAVLYKEKGKYDIATPFYDEMLSLSKELFKPYDVKLSDSLALYAELLRKRQNIDDAMVMHEEALSIRLAEAMGMAMGQSHVGGSPSSSKAKAIRGHLDSFDELPHSSTRSRGKSGEPSLRSPQRKKSVSALEQSSSQLEIKLSDSYTFIGCCLAAKKRPVEAAKKHQEALRLRVKHLSGVHPLLSESLNYVGEAMLLQGYPDHALPYVQAQRTARPPEEIVKAAAEAGCRKGLRKEERGRPRYTVNAIKAAAEAGCRRSSAKKSRPPKERPSRPSRPRQKRVARGAA